MSNLDGDRRRDRAKQRNSRSSLTVALSYKCIAQQKDAELRQAKKELDDLKAIIHGAVEHPSDQQLAAEYADLERVLDSAPDRPVQTPTAAQSVAAVFLPDTDINPSATPPDGEAIEPDMAAGSSEISKHMDASQRLPEVGILIQSHSQPVQQALGPSGGRTHRQPAHRLDTEELGDKDVGVLQLPADRGVLSKMFSRLRERLGSKGGSGDAFPDTQQRCEQVIAATQNGVLAPSANAFLPPSENQRARLVGLPFHSQRWATEAGAGPRQAPSHEVHMAPLAKGLGPLAQGVPPRLGRGLGRSSTLPGTYRNPHEDAALDARPRVDVRSCALFDVQQPYGANTAALVTGGLPAGSVADIPFGGGPGYNTHIVPLIEGLGPLARGAPPRLGLGYGHCPTMPSSYRRQVPLDELAAGTQPRLDRDDIPPLHGRGTFTSRAPVMPGFEHYHHSRGRQGQRWATDAGAAPRTGAGPADELGPLAHGAALRLGRALGRSITLPGSRHEQGPFDDVAMGRGADAMDYPRFPTTQPHPSSGQQHNTAAQQTAVQATVPMDFWRYVIAAGLMALGGPAPVQPVHQQLRPPDVRPSNPLPSRQPSAIAGATPSGLAGQTGAKDVAASAPDATGATEPPRQDCGSGFGVPNSSCPKHMKAPNESHSAWPHAHQRPPLPHGPHRNVGSVPGSRRGSEGGSNAADAGAPAHLPPNGAGLSANSSRRPSWGSDIPAACAFAVPTLDKSAVAASETAAEHLDALAARLPQPPPRSMDRSVSATGMRPAPGSPSSRMVVDTGSPGRQVVFPGHPVARHTDTMGSRKPTQPPPTALPPFDGTRGAAATPAVAVTSSRVCTLAGARPSQPMQDTDRSKQVEAQWQGAQVPGNAAPCAPMEACSSAVPSSGPILAKQAHAPGYPLPADNSSTLGHKVERMDNVVAVASADEVRRANMGRAPAVAVGRDLNGCLQVGEQGTEPKAVLSGTRLLPTRSCGPPQQPGVIAAPGTLTWFKAMAKTRPTRYAEEEASACDSGSAPSFETMPTASAGTATCYSAPGEPYLRPSTCSGLRQPDVNKAPMARTQCHAASVAKAPLPTPVLPPAPVSATPMLRHQQLISPISSVGSCILAADLALIAAAPLGSISLKQDTNQCSGTTLARSVNCDATPVTRHSFHHFEPFGGRRVEQPIHSPFVSSTLAYRRCSGDRDIMDTTPGIFPVEAAAPPVASLFGPLQAQASYDSTASIYASVDTPRGSVTECQAHSEGGVASEAPSPAGKRAAAEVVHKRAQHASNSVFARAAAQAAVVCHSNIMQEVASSEFGPREEAPYEHGLQESRASAAGSPAAHGLTRHWLRRSVGVTAAKEQAAIRSLRSENSLAPNLSRSYSVLPEAPPTSTARTYGRWCSMPNGRARSRGTSDGDAADCDTTPPGSEPGGIPAKHTATVQQGTPAAQPAPQVECPASQALCTGSTSGEPFVHPAAHAQPMPAGTFASPPAWPPGQVLAHDDVPVGVRLPGAISTRRTPTKDDTQSQPSAALFAAVPTRSPISAVMGHGTYNSLIPPADAEAAGVEAAGRKMAMISNGFSIRFPASPPLYAPLAGSGTTDPSHDSAHTLGRIAANSGAPFAPFMASTPGGLASHDGSSGFCASRDPADLRASYSIFSVYGPSGSAPGGSTPAKAHDGFTASQEPTLSPCRQNQAPPCAQRTGGSSRQCLPVLRASQEAATQAYLDSLVDLAEALAAGQLQSDDPRVTPLAEALEDPGATGQWLRGQFHAIMATGQVADDGEEHEDSEEEEGEVDGEGPETENEDGSSGDGLTAATPGHATYASGMQARSPGDRYASPPAASGLRFEPLRDQTPTQTLNKPADYRSPTPSGQHVPSSVSGGFSFGDAAAMRQVGTGAGAATPGPATPTFASVSFGGKPAAAGGDPAASGAATPQLFGLTTGSGVTKAPGALFGFAAAPMSTGFGPNGAYGAPDGTPSFGRPPSQDAGSAKPSHHAREAQTFQPPAAAAAGGPSAPFGFGPGPQGQPTLARGGPQVGPAHLASVAPPPKQLQFGADAGPEASPTYTATRSRGRRHGAVTAGFMPAASELRVESSAFVSAVSNSSGPSNGGGSPCQAGKDWDPVTAAAAATPMSRPRPPPGCTDSPVMMYNACYRAAANGPGEDSSSSSIEETAPDGAPAHVAPAIAEPSPLTIAPVRGRPGPYGEDLSNATPCSHRVAATAAARAQWGMTQERAMGQQVGPAGFTFAGAAAAVASTSPEALFPSFGVRLFSEEQEGAEEGEGQVGEDSDAWEQASIGTRVDGRASRRSTRAGPSDGGWCGAGSGGGALESNIYDVMEEEEGAHGEDEAWGGEQEFQEDQAMMARMREAMSAPGPVRTFARHAPAGMAAGSAYVSACSSRHVSGGGAPPRTP